MQNIYIKRIKSFEKLNSRDLLPEMRKREKVFYPQCSSLAISNNHDGGNQQDL